MASLSVSFSLPPSSKEELTLIDAGLSPLADDPPPPLHPPPRLCPLARQRHSRLLRLSLPQTPLRPGVDQVRYGGVAGEFGRDVDDGGDGVCVGEGEKEVRGVRGGGRKRRKRKKEVAFVHKLTSVSTPTAHVAPNAISSYCIFASSRAPVIVTLFSLLSLEVSGRGDDDPTVTYLNTRGGDRTTERTPEGKKARKG